MPRDQDLTVFLCVENVDNCDILLNQLGSGEVFGPNQYLNLILQGCDQNELEALRWDVQDCAFPLILGVSTCATFANAGLKPDAVMVLLADRGVHSQVSTTAANHDHLKNLLGLVHYTESLASAFDTDALKTSPIVMLGDLAHTAASLLSSYLSTTLEANQLIALDGKEENSKPRLLAKGRGQMSKVTRFCDALRQWWNGWQAIPDKKAKLGTKFVDTKQRNIPGKSTGYFFTAPVDFSGPTTFSARFDLDVDQSHISNVKTDTEAAYALVARNDGFKNKQDHSSVYHTAHL